MVEDQNGTCSGPKGKRPTSLGEISPALGMAHRQVQLDFQTLALCDDD
jgi:hypothetical protein